MDKDSLMEWAEGLGIKTGQDLKKWRKSQRLTQDELSWHLQYNEDSISRIERSDPTLSVRLLARLHDWPNPPTDYKVQYYDCLEELRKYTDDDKSQHLTDPLVVSCISLDKLKISYKTQVNQLEDLLTELLTIPESYTEEDTEKHITILLERLTDIRNHWNGYWNVN